MCLVIITVATTTAGSIYIPNIFNALGSLKYNCLFIPLNNPVKWVHFYFYFTDETKAERLRNLFKALQLINNRRQNSNQEYSDSRALVLSLFKGSNFSTSSPRAIVFVFFIHNSQTAVKWYLIVESFHFI